ncbi:ice-structuring glycoprotein-like [Thrips palmi]|uniref:Ice-structuring glycoprotein-like n=1 Tax=Thrips palmi TaxID=161013 RepID=A0A6P8ZTN5_THRPL|nr:ice-structuring glycoprotein-like [Thrips palmi]
MTAKMNTAWALSLLVLALAGCSATKCRHEGRFWDGCNWCYCRDHYVVGCTNMACLSLPEDAYRIDPHRATIGPPQREGLFAYQPGRGRVVDPSGWPCQMGSSWLEEGGCVRCICANKMIKCRDSGMCLNGEPVSNELMPPQTEYVRRRREDASAAAATPAPPAAPVAEPAVEPTAALAESTTSTAWVATEPAAATTAAAGVAEVAESTVAPAGPAAEAANATRSTVAPPATTTAQNTVVKDRSCRSGSTWEEDCNSCWCLDNGRAACTTNSCEPPPPLTLGAPGSHAATIAGGPGGPGAAPAIAVPGAAAPAAAVPAAGAPASGVAPAAAPAPAAGAVQATVPSSTPSSAAVTAAVPIAEPAAAPAGGAVVGGSGSSTSSAAGSRRKRRVVLLGA